VACRGARQAGASPEECAAALAAYLGRAAALQAGAGGAGGGASAEAGAELAARIAEGCAGETEFLFSHIRQVRRPPSPPPLVQSGHAASVTPY